MIHDDLHLAVQLGLAAKLLGEVEDQRKRNSNRREVLTRPRDKADSDGEYRGFGLPEDDPAIGMLDAHLAEIVRQETALTKELERLVKKHPLAGWITAQRGVGLKSLGRLLAAIEDPSWHPVEERPRTLPELNSYCGMVPGYRRIRGVPADQVPQWNAEAKMRLYLIAEMSSRQLDPACKEHQDPDRSWVVQHVEDCRCGPYRLVYEQRRAHTAERLHDEPCVRCGPSGKPAAAGSPLSKTHQRGDALRYVAKRILRDLWREARRVNGIADPEVSAA